MNQITVEKLRQTISFLHSGIPDCASPIVSNTGEVPEYPGIHGTGFFARKGNSVVFITARHCLTNNSVDDIAEIASRLQIPYTLRGFKASQNDYVRFGHVYSFRHNSPDIPGEFVDFVVLTIETLRGSKHDKQLRSRAAKLPPTGDWLDQFSRAALVQEAFLNGGNLPMIAIGYPFAGTQTEITENGEIVTQLVTVSGNLRPGVYPHTMSMIDISWQHDLDGFSGSPVFTRFRDEHGLQFALAGMLVVGGNRQAQFIRISQITGSQFDPPLDFSIRD